MTPRTVPITRHNTSDPAFAEGYINPDEVSSTDQAYCTSRALDGSDDHGYAQEWQEPGLLPDGRECLITYLFDDEDLTDGNGNEYEDAEFYPWDSEHVARILLVG